MELILDTPEETEAVGAALWNLLPNHCLLFLHGDLGAGKTTLIRGLLRAAGYQGAVRSPTYSLVEEYRFPNGRQVFHFDLYRLKDPEELEWMGMEDYLRQPALCCIEWPEMGGEFLPRADIEISIEHQNQGRLIKINTLTPLLEDGVIPPWKNKDILL